MKNVPQKILIIEDNQASLDLIVYLLKSFGHTPVTAMDGLEGVEIAWRERPDLILCDIQLPGADGIEVCKKVKANLVLSKIPIIAVTAYSMVGDREKLLAQGFDGYISKPIEPRTFIDQLKPYLEWKPKQASNRDIGLKQGTILVVDNSPANRQLSHSMLEPFGYTIIDASSADEALAFLRHRPADAILSDVHMPVNDGFDFIEAVKSDASLAGIPFLFISSTLWGDCERERGLQLGAASFVTRPIEPAALIEQIEAARKSAIGKTV